MSPIDPSINFHKARELHHRGTCQWLLDSKAYISWRTNRGSFLWLHGIPGCGKTILSSTVVNDLHQNATTSQGLLYFYFDFTDAEKRSVENALRSLISQLYRKREITRPDLDTLYTSCKENGTQPNHASLQSVFQSMIQRCADIWIVIAALDECEVRNEFTADGLLPWIRKLRYSVSNVHLLVTSRPEQDIKSAIESWASIDDGIPLQNHLIADDICSYIHTRVRQMHRWHSRLDVQSDIETTLVKKADGM